MRSQKVCHCCGLGIALAGFSGMNAGFNFVTARMQSLTTDSDGWINLSRDHVWPLMKSTTNVRVTYGVSQFAMRLNEGNSSVEIDLTLLASEIGLPGFNIIDEWSWNLTYEIPYADYNKVISEGRLRLNPYQTSVQHAGDTYAVIPAATVNALNQSLSVVGPTNLTDTLGDIVLVWPPFDLNWHNKRLTFTMTATNPIATHFFDGYEVLNVSWASQLFEFVFDDASLTDWQTPFALPAFIDRHDHDYASDCWEYIEAAHPWDVTRRGSINISSIIQSVDERQYPSTLNLSFKSAIRCNDLGTPGFIPPASGVQSPMMQWSMSGIYWKAFAENDKLTATDNTADSPHVSPLLHQGPVPRALTLDQKEVGTVTVELELLPIE